MLLVAKNDFWDPAKIRNIPSRARLKTLKMHAVNAYHQVMQELVSVQQDHGHLMKSLGAMAYDAQHTKKWLAVMQHSSHAVQGDVTYLKDVVVPKLQADCERMNNALNMMIPVMQHMMDAVLEHRRLLKEIDDKQKMQDTTIEYLYMCTEAHQCREYSARRKYKEIEMCLVKLDSTVSMLFEQLQFLLKVARCIFMFMFQFGSSQFGASGFSTPTEVTIAPIGGAPIGACFAPVPRDTAIRGIEVVVVG